MATKRKTPRKPSSNRRAASRYLNDVLAGRVDDPTTHYALDVQAGRIVAGPWVRLAAERHLRDLERRDIVWDLAAGKRALDFFPTVLRLNGGEFEGLPFTLQRWQQFIVGSLFGWKRLDRTRRFRTAYCEVGKGNGKSPLAAGIGHKLLVDDDEPRAEIYAAATKKDQAQILFRDAVAMRDLSPALSKRLRKSGIDPVWNLAHVASGSFFRPIASDSAQSGPRPHGGLIDELHEHPSSEVVDMMRRGVKGRRQPLIFEITNSGFDRNSICWHHHEYSTKVLQGVLQNDEWFAYVAALDEGDDWTDERVWLKANPNLGVSIPLSYLRTSINEALGMPTLQNVVKRLNFCIWTQVDKVGIDAEAWRACALPVDEAALAGRECFAGLDLSTTTDITSLQLFFPALDGGKAQLVRRYWIPSDNLLERCRRDHVPYDHWRDAGHLTTTPGNTIDYGFIRREINRLAERFQIHEVAYDPFNATDLVTALQGDGFVMVPIRQSFSGLSAATKELLRLVGARELATGGDPVLAWMASNVAFQEDAAGNIRPNKAKSTGRIDGIVALVEAIDRASRHGMIPRSIYEDRHLLDQQAGDEPEDGDAAAPQAQQTAPRRQVTTPPVDSAAGEAATRPRRTRSVYDTEEWNRYGEDANR